VTIDAKMAYRDKEDKDDDWKYYASSREERILECTMKEVWVAFFFKSKARINAFFSEKSWLLLQLLDSPTF
jgi:hypothetical protein